MLRPAILLAGLLLAGCVTVPTTPTTAPPDASQAGRILPWGLTKCTYLVGWAPADPAKIAPYMPKGFTPSPYGPAGTGTPADPAMLGFEAFRCESGAGMDNAKVPGMTYASYWSGATPPKELREEGIGIYDVRWDTLVPDAPRRDAMLGGGLPARAGNATVTPSATGVSARYTMEGVGTGANVLEMTAATRTIAAPQKGKAVEFTPTADGAIAIWRMDFAWEGAMTQGVGTITPAAGSWAEKVLGAGPSPAQFHTGVWTFSNGTLTLPPKG